MATVKTADQPRQSDDYDFIIKVIEWLNREYGIRFFITPRDFDTLYRWWEKHIPLSVLRTAMGKVVARRRKKGLSVDTFANFTYEVSKQFRQHMELNVGTHVSVERAPHDPAVEWELFLEDLHPALADFRLQLLAVLTDIRAGREIRRAELEENLLDYFRSDPELDAQSRLFLSHLPPQVQKEKMLKKYRISLIKSRYRIPDMESTPE